MARTILELDDNLQLGQARVMGINRIELTGFTDTMVDHLKDFGLFSEIISWKLRLFVPADTGGAEILAKLFDRYQINRISEREVA